MGIAIFLASGHFNPSSTNLRILNKCSVRLNMHSWDWLTIVWHDLSSFLLQVVGLVYMSVKRAIKVIKMQSRFSPGIWPRQLSLPTLYHLNLPRTTSASGEEELWFNRVTNLSSRLSSLRRTKHLVKSTLPDLLLHWVDCNILTLV